MGYLTKPTDPPDWCPTCQPDLDPFADVVVERWCFKHAPDRGGPDDAAVEEILRRNRDAP